MPEPFLIHTESLSGLPQFSRVAFDGVPIVSPGLVTIVSDQSANGRQLAVELAKELREALVASGPSVDARDLPDVRQDDPTTIPGFQDPGRSKVLVLVGDGQPFEFKRWYTKSAVLPVLRAGASVAENFPGDEFNDPTFGAIRRINAKFWSNRICEVVPAIFGLVGLTTESQRVFISYRRAETQPLALQLFDALTHEGLDVFLDRFTIAPGVNFQQKLYQELAEKSMVLLLESEHLSSSDWTQAEIDHCKKYRLGLYSLQMPKVTKENAVASIGMDTRRVLHEKDFENPAEMVDNPSYPGKSDKPEPRQVLQWKTLKKDVLEDVLLQLKMVHDRALLRRRRYLRDVMRAALKNAGVFNPDYNEAGMLVVDGATGNRYSVWMTTRPPELPDFHLTQVQTVIPPPRRGIVIGPLVLLEPSSKTRVDWLSTVSKMECIDESQIDVVADKLVKGTL